jgi:hypothetical protein
MKFAAPGPLSVTFVSVIGIVPTVDQFDELRRARLPGRDHRKRRRRREQSSYYAALRLNRRRAGCQPSNSNDRRILEW